ncbi:MAG: Trehalose/maltose import ATP-binding protein MalK [Methanomassiliicoccales archaeon PtaB.Bin134]|jgi:ABC-2 type transport system ATP-binding protein|nr:MAG: Trehalose/maltose import ATP-binding protein MalK [Methanomassiliicoccales archaeon PtaB.Bin134]
MFAVEVNDLVKSYGSFQAVKGISFRVREGEVYGLIGPNGAGKTTTLRILATLLEVTDGSIKVQDIDLRRDPEEVRKVISYLPEDAGAYKHLKGRDYLKFIAEFFAEGKEAQALVERGLEIANLGERIDDKVETYSKGMARRLLVARALMIRPKLAILDELTSGLDVLNAQEIRRTVKNFASQGTTVLLSSHNMLEVELLCDRIALINDGRIVAEGTPTELKERYGAQNIEEVFVKVVRQ